MARIETWLKCNLGTPVKVQYLDGHMFSMDNMGNLVGVEVFDIDGNPASISGTVTGHVIRADGGTVAVTNAAIDGNKAYIILPQAAYAKPGTASIIIKLTTDSVITTLAAVVVTIYESVTSTAVDPGTVINSIDTLIASINTAVASIPADYSSLWASLAAPFNTSTNYVAGQYCTYNSKFYRFTSAHSGNWNASHVVEVKVGGELNDLKNALAYYEKYVVGKENMLLETSWNNGAYISESGDITPYATAKYTDLIPTNGKDNFTYYYKASTSSSTTRIHGYDSNGDWVAQITTATTGTTAIIKEIQIKNNGYAYIRISESTSVEPVVLIDGASINNEVERFLDLVNVNYEFVEGYYFNVASEAVTADSDYEYTKINVSLYCGGKMHGITGVLPNATNHKIAFVDLFDHVITSYSNPNTGNYTYAYNLDVPNNASYVYIPLRIASASVWVAPSFDLDTVFDNLSELYGLTTEIDTLKRQTKGINIPELRNGSAGNSGNTNAITTKYILPIDKTKDELIIEYIGDTSLANQYAFSYCAFSGATDGMATSAAFTDQSISKVQYNSEADIRTAEPYLIVPVSNLRGYDHIAFTLWRLMNETVVPLRIATDQNNFRISFKIGTSGDSESELSITKHDLLYAKHAKGNTGTRLTLLHFSDLHKDTGALSRIMSEGEDLEYDDAICTGDMVANTAEQIASWWEASVLTCIGNHDTASYSSETGYNWTALSMANRSAYYIEPFESGWGITHTSGKSYYYKDYSNAKVRMIVMDAMLYTDNGQDATDQTTWLEGLLASAITNNLHVLIAIHAPHGGATAKDCSFSRYGQTAMPINSDCDTPQAVIDAVATKISGGLKFIGYLVGHTHQDNIWDAEGDGKQLMYCVTCGIVSQEAQWKNSDQHRDTKNDAYNLITIDTANTLVKIIRGGGANMDDHMRTRKAICFNYSTGQKIGEIL